MLVDFDDQNKADGFYLDLNGWRFTSAEVLQFLVICRDALF